MELKKVVLRTPTVLGYSYEGNIKPSLAKLQERLGLSEVELKKVVLGQPTVLSLSYEGNLELMLDHLQSELGLALDALRELVLKNPLVLGASLDASLRPNIVLWREWLAEEGLQLAEVVAKSGPRILRASKADAAAQRTGEGARVQSQRHGRCRRFDRRSLRRAAGPRHCPCA